MARLHPPRLLISHLLIIIAALLIGTRTGAMKMVTLAPQQAIFLTSAISFIALIPLWRRIRLVNLTPLVLRTVTDRGVLFFAYLLLTTLPTVHVTLMINWGPLFLPFLFWLWARCPIIKKEWLWLVIAWAGSVIVCLPETFGSWNFKLLGLGAGLLQGLTLVTTGEMTEKGKPLDILVTSHLLATIGLLPIAFWHWKAPTGTDWGLLAVIAVVTVGIELLSYWAGRKGPIYPLHPLVYLAVAVSFCIDWAVWDYIPLPLFTIGALLSILGCALLLRCRSISNKVHL